MESLVSCPNLAGRKLFGGKETNSYVHSTGFLGKNRQKIARSLSFQKDLALSRIGSSRIADSETVDAISEDKAAAYVQYDGSDKDLVPLGRCRCAGVVGRASRRRLKAASKPELRSFFRSFFFARVRIVQTSLGQEMRLSKQYHFNTKLSAKASGLSTL